MIIEKNNNNPKYFDDIEQGEVFLYQGKYYIKTEILDKNNTNCIELKNGNSDMRFDSDVVYKIKCRLVID